MGSPLGIAVLASDSRLGHLLADRVELWQITLLASADPPSRAGSRALLVHVDHLHRIPYGCPAELVVAVTETEDRPVVDRALAQGVDVVVSVEALDAALSDGRLRPEALSGTWARRRAGRSLVQRIEDAATQRRGVTFVSAEVPLTVSWTELHSDARAVAAGLQLRGIRPGDRVALLGVTSRALVTTLQAVWLAGATTVVLPLPQRLASIEEFVAQTRARIERAEVALVAIDPDFGRFLAPEPGDPPLAAFDELVGDAGRWVRPDDDLDRIAILQFTSGSTGDPKGVILPHHTVGANLDAIAAATALDPERDVAVSWLPLYHDMGLVGLLTVPMTTGTALVLGSPEVFMARPAVWMEWVSAYGGTATAGPNFSYALAARALDRGPALDLSRLRVALYGAEPVDPDTVRAFVDAGARHGLLPDAIFPAFGMAEVAIAGTFPEPLSGLRTDVVDRRTLECQRRAVPVLPGREGARELAILGRPVPGLAIRVVDPETGEALGDRAVGELEIRGTSVTPGYHARPDSTSALFHDGWLRTGDLAYLVDGELVVCGRLKDLIIVGGRNVFPEDVERAVVGVEGVRAGNVVAFGVGGDSGKESLVVVAEARAADGAELRRVVADRVRRSIGLPAKDVVLVAPGTLPKTSSGKLRRSLCKRRYLCSELRPI